MVVLAASTVAAVTRKCRRCRGSGADPRPPSQNGLDMLCRICGGSGVRVAWLEAVGDELLARAEAAEARVASLEAALRELDAAVTEAIHLRATYPTEMPYDVQGTAIARVGAARVQAEAALESPSSQRSETP